MASTPAREGDALRVVECRCGRALVRRHAPTEDCGRCHRPLRFLQTLVLGKGGAVPDPSEWEPA